MKAYTENILNKSTGKTVFLEDYRKRTNLYNLLDSLGRLFDGEIPLNLRLVNAIDRYPGKVT